MGLLISATGTRFPRGGPGASSALAPVGSPVTSDPAGVECPPLQSTARQNNQTIVFQHTFLFNFAKCIAILFMFWQAAVRRACSLTFFNPRNRQ
jgi:hypothetical protein